MRPGEGTMSLSLEQLTRLNGLLSHALELPAADRDAWLESLGPQHADIRAVLRETLSAEASGALTAQHWTLPHLPAQPEAQAGRFQAGETLGPYELLRQLGAGGMAQVWLARRSDGELKRHVALKLPVSSRPRDDLARRLLRERDILAALEHPNIARLYDAGVAADGTPYLAMEYVAGEPLTAWCDARQMDVHGRIEIFLQVLDAVRYAHERQILHRDIKPSNILVTQDAQARLLDFGIAKMLDEPVDQDDLTRLYGRVLTAEYASPEQLRGDPIEATSDVFALGVILYELLAGSRPYRVKPGAAPGIVEQTLAQARIQNPSTQVGDAAAQARATTSALLCRHLRGDLDAIVMKALEHDPRRRYGDAGSFSDDLRRFLRGAPVQAQAQTAGYRLAKLLRRHRALS